MKHARNLVRDLVERRLWPLAVLLVVAAIAVPVYLGRSSSNDGEGDGALPPATAQVGAKASKAAVTLDDSSAEGGTGGAVRNPFKQQHVAKAADADAGAGAGAKPASSGAASPAAGSGSAGSSGGAAPTGSGGSGGSDTSGGSDKSPSADKPDPDVSHVTLRFGKVGELKTYTDLARLSALPSATDPQFVFTGVLKDGKTAVLLPSSVVQIGEESDVKCKPSNKSCQELEVAEDDTVFFKLSTDTVGEQYQLDVVSVQRKRGSSAKAAAAALKRHSEAGAATLRDAHVNASASFQGASAYRWLPDQGVLVRTPRHSKAHASANGAAAASAADVDATLPGLPVWHWQPGV
jgi:hypothetical protein